MLWHSSPVTEKIISNDRPIGHLRQCWYLNIDSLIPGGCGYNFHLWPHVLILSYVIIFNIIERVYLVFFWLLIQLLKLDLIQTDQTSYYQMPESQITWGHELWWPLMPLCIFSNGFTLYGMMTSTHCVTTTGSQWCQDHIMRWKYFLHYWPFLGESMLALSEGNPLVTSRFSSQKAIKLKFWCFLWCEHEQAVKQQTVHLSLIWGAMTLMWCHWNIWR